MSELKVKSNKVTTVLADDLRGEVDQLAERSGFGISDLLRQGLIKILLEVRQTGKFETVQLPPRDAAAA